MNNLSGFMRELDGQENLSSARGVDRLSNRLQFRCRRLLAAKEVALLDDCRGFLGHHVFPSGLSSLNLVQNVAGENIHN